MKVAFMGNPKFALPSLESLLQSKHEVKAVVSNPAKPMGRKRALKHTDVGNFSLQNNIELIELDSFNNDAIYKKLLSLNVDIFVVVAFRILPEKYISINIFIDKSISCLNLPKL